MSLNEVMSPSYQEPPVTVQTILNTLVNDIGKLVNNLKQQITLQQPQAAQAAGDQPTSPTNTGFQQPSGVWPNVKQMLKRLWMGKYADMPPGTPREHLNLQDCIELQEISEQVYGLVLTEIAVTPALDKILRDFKSKLTVTMMRHTQRAFKLGEKKASAAPAAPPVQPAVVPKAEPVVQATPEPAPAEIQGGPVEVPPKTRRKRKPKPEPAAPVTGDPDSEISRIYDPAELNSLLGKAIGNESINYQLSFSLAEGIVQGLTPKSQTQYYKQLLENSILIESKKPRSFQDQAEYYKTLLTDSLS